MRAWLRGLLAVAALATANARPLQAQWSVGLDLGGARYHGGTARTSPSDEQETFRPDRPTLVGLRVARGLGPWHVGLGLSHGDADLVLDGRSTAVVVKDAFTVLGLAPEIGYRLTRARAPAELRLALGPVIEWWDVVETGYRTRLGGQAAATLTLPITGALVGRARAEVAVVGSPFEAAELPSDYRPTTLWRRSLAAGVSLRL